uniref:Cystatin domain-containing protein n=1 Tax=Wuchereria bancrofti TaxID=6293 RepID=A0A1I8F1L2_WUCBA
MLLIRTTALIALANIITVLSSIVHTTKKFNNDNDQQLSIDQMKNVRQSFLIGGKHDVEQIDNTQFEDMSWRAATEMNRASNDAYHWIPVKVLRVTSQVVAGVKYIIDVLVAQSNCTKNG